MNKEAQRIAIARVCGLKIRKVIYNKGTAEVWVSEGREPIPDYLGDLNACHEMEEIIRAKGLSKTYFNHLYHAVNQECVEATGYEFDDLVSCAEVATYAVSATAAQRCEAFLKTLGLWTTSDQVNKDYGDHVNPCDGDYSL